jgi:hypothetical protein
MSTFTAADDIVVSTIYKEEIPTLATRAMLDLKQDRDFESLKTRFSLCLEELDNVVKGQPENGPQGIQPNLGLLFKVLTRTSVHTRHTQPKGPLLFFALPKAS